MNSRCGKPESLFAILLAHSLQAAVLINKDHLKRRGSRSHSRKPKFRAGVGPKSNRELAHAPVGV
jgi:hypothetical protein